MSPFIFTSRSGVHIINLEVTKQQLATALSFVSDLVAGGGIILLVTLPLLLILKRESFAELAANGAFYMLFAGTLPQLIKFFFEKSHDGLHPKNR